MSRRSSTGSSGRRTSAPGARLLHLDVFSGVAGNMFMGALLDAGLSRRELEADLAGLPVEFELKVQRVTRGALTANYVDVLVPAKSAGKQAARKKAAGKKRAKKKTAKKKTARKASEAAHDHAHGPDDSHEPGHTHGHDHSHAGHDHDGQIHAGHHHGATDGHGRSYREICRLLERAKLDAGVRERALEIFEALGRAEARVHGTKIDDVHFHEVGAVDAIVDVTGAAIGLARLGVQRVTSSSIALGHGTVETAHGRLPLPAPATLELLKGIPTVPAHIAWETVTPTGAAIVRTVVDEFRELPAMTLEAIGHGAGRDRPGPMPNLLRVMLGSEGGAGWDRIVSLETNLDDLVPEHFDFLMERLFEDGALDVSLQNIQMKKNRPGFLVRVLARPSDRAALAARLMSESTAIGVRSTEWDRIVLEREQRRVDTPHGRIRIKCVSDLRGGVDVSAEYDDCRKAARRSGASLREVVRVAEEIARKELT